ncbi:MAG: GntR family transcriptional regulator [Atopobiaceae bacterium]|nr:GntR family transcriptional regulator [Atopobiaceae bacterium]
MIYLDLVDEIIKEYEGAPYFSPMLSEREMCEKYHVSRPTIRKALQHLENEGIIKVLRGKGAFFLGSGKLVKSSFTMGRRKIGFYDQVVSQGSVPTSKVLTQDIQPADKLVAAKLKIKRGDPVFCLERVRYVDGEVFSVNSSRISYKLCPKLTEHDFSGDASLHHVLESYGHIPHHADRVIEVGHAGEYEAIHLGLSVGEPIAITHTETFDENGRVLEFAVTKHSAYKSRFEMTVYSDR